MQPARRRRKFFFHGIVCRRIVPGRPVRGGPVMPSDDTRDEEVMAQVARGHAQLLERLIRRYATPLLTFIRRQVGDRHHSEELFQEVFLAVWTKRHQYEFPRSFKNWLYAIALNKCRARFRERSLS